MDFLQIILIIAGAGGGGLLAWVVKSVQSSFEISSIKSKLSESEKNIETLNKMNLDMKFKLVKVQTLLTDALSAIDLLEKYRIIDEATKKKIEEIDSTLVDGTPTDLTFAKYEEIIKQMNDAATKYNKPKTTAKKTGGKK